MNGIPIILSEYKIFQYFISFSLKKNLPNFTNKYYDLNIPTLFIGIFNDIELDLLEHHKGDKYILWIGNDCNPDYKTRKNIMKRVAKLNIIKHFCVTDRTNKYLLIGGIIKDFIYYKVEFQLKDIQIYVSSSLKHLESRIKKKYNLLDYTDINSPCVFFGVYNENDINMIESHENMKYVMWGGTDCSFSQRTSNFNRIKHMIDILHIAISENMEKRLNIYNFLYKYFNLNLTDNNIFRPQKTKGNKIFIYNGFSKGNENLYGKEIYEKVIQLLPEYKYIFSNDLNYDYEDMPKIYTQCFIGLRLTKDDGNANMVQEMEAMNIPVVHNCSQYGLKWESINDILMHIEKEFDFDENNITNNNLKYFNQNIDHFSHLISEYKNILFICGDYPGYGGSATNCLNLQKFYSKNHNTYIIYYNFKTESTIKIESNDDYCIINYEDIEDILLNLNFTPDLIILKSIFKYDLKNIFSCPIYYCIGGIYNNCLDKYYYELQNVDEYDEYINLSVIKQIEYVNKSFTNSKLTKKILYNIYNLDVDLFYSSFIPFYKKEIVQDVDFKNRKYNYGFIVSDFNRPIKNIEKSIEFLKNKEKVLLIGRNSYNYKKYGFDCIDLIDHDAVNNYLKEIKYVYQDSFYESCSNIKVESIFNGCKVIPPKIPPKTIIKKITKTTIGLFCTQLPYNGGASTLCYDMYDYYAINKMFNVKMCFFLHRKEIKKVTKNILLLNPNNYKDVFMLPNEYSQFKKYNFVEDTLKNLEDIDTVIAINYGVIPIIKNYYNGKLIYQLVGSPELTLGNESPISKKISYKSFMNDESYDINLLKDTKGGLLNYISLFNSDIILANSKLTYDLYIKIYPEFTSKIKYTHEIEYEIYKKKLHINSRINYNTLQYKNREFDLITVSNSWTRPVKNIKLIYDIYNKLPNLNKVIIGKKNNEYNFEDIQNTTVLDQIDNKLLHKMLLNSKNVLICSYFESASITLLEGLHNGCKIITSKNVGLSILIPNQYLCEDVYDIDEWLRTIDLLEDIESIEYKIQNNLENNSIVLLNKSIET